MSSDGNEINCSQTLCSVQQILELDNVRTMDILQETIIEQDEDVVTENICEVDGFNSAVRAPLLREIINSSTHQAWYVSRLGNNRPVKVASVDKCWWRTWSSVIRNRNFSFIFGAENPNNPETNLYIVPNSKNKLKLTIVGSDPYASSGVANDDPRVFVFQRLQATQQYHFMHLKTGKYVGLKRNRLVLLDEDKSSSWQFVGK